MDLYEVKYNSSLLVIDFISPLFYEGKSELDVLGKFVKDCEKQSSFFNPRNITVIKICKLKEIRK